MEHKDGFGVDFFGTGGEVRVNRGQFVLIVDGKTIAEHTDEKRKKGSMDSGEETTCAQEVKKAETLYLANAPIKLYVSKNHSTDFLECVKSRKKPITNEQVGGALGHLLPFDKPELLPSRALKWDPTKFKFIAGTGNPKWLTRDYRAPWSA